MKLQELAAGTELIIEMAWERNKLEFPSSMVSSDGEEGIFIMPYLRDGRPLKLQVDPKGDVVCSIYVTDPYSGERISWKNVYLNTVSTNDKVFYHITTMKFNSLSVNDERRTHIRTIEEKMADVTDMSGEMVNVTIHDVSDTGISFYTDYPIALNPKNILIDFADVVNDDTFVLKIKCQLARSNNDNGRYFYGCEVVEPTRDYLLYVLLHRKFHD